MAEQTPGWHPDPSGRHQHRFWDGTTWTDGVADDGRVTSDTGPLHPGDPTSGRGAGPFEAPGPGVSVAAARRRWPVVAAGAVVAALVVVAGIALLGGGDSSGSAGATTEHAKTGHPISRSIHLRAGEAVGFEVRAEDKDVKFRVAIAVDPRTHAAIDRTFGSDATDAYGTDDYTAFFGDGDHDHRLLFAGRMRGFFAESFVAPAAGTYTLAVQPDQDATLRLDIETERKADLAGSYTPLQLYALRRNTAYRPFFAAWDRRSQGDVGAFTDFSDPYSDESASGDDQMTDYFSEYSDYLDSDYSGDSGSSS